MDVKKDTGFRVYSDGYLLYVRMAITKDYNDKINAYFLKSRVQSTHTKKYQYEINVKLDLMGSIERSHCECPAGGGPLAHCKHVIAMLWGVEQLVREGKIILASTCTQKLQTFHQPTKQYHGTPQTCMNLNSSRQRDLNFDPLDQKYLNPESYRRLVRRQCISFTATKESNMAIMQLYKPANIPAILHDHNYTNIDYVYELMRSLYLKDVTPDVIAEIENMTRDQNQNPKWFEIRRHRITASNVGRVCSNFRNDETRWNLVRNLFNPTPIKAKALDHGILCESTAIKLFEDKFGAQVKPCGLILDMTYPFIAASPDGLYEDNTVIEVKCPYNQRFCEISAQTVPFLIEVDGRMLLDSTHPYYKQIQTQMYVTNRQYGKLIVYTFKGIKVINVSKDLDMINIIIQKCKDFYENYFEPFLINEYLFKNYTTVFPNEFKNDWKVNSKYLLQ